LKKAVTRRFIWGWVDNIEVLDGDIDHLIIAPAGFCSGLEVACAEAQPVAACRRRAKRDHSGGKGALCPEILKRPLDVHPIVVVWGAGEMDVPGGGGLIDGIDVVAGHEIAAWLQRCSTGPVRRDFAEAVLTELETFRARVDPAREARKRTRSTESQAPETRRFAGASARGMPVRGRARASGVPATGRECRHADRVHP
jgi:hypothetical protein